MIQRALLITIFGVLSFVILAVSPIPSYCQEEDNQPQHLEASGSVSEMDIVAGKIAVNIGSGMMVFFVSDQTKIMKGAEMTSIEDIEIGDPLAITYYEDKDGRYQAVMIMDSNLSEAMQ